VKLKNKRVLVLGAGISGRSAKSFLEAKGAEVVVFDDASHGDAVKHTPSSPTTMPPLSLKGEHAEIVTARDDLSAAADGFDLCVISPGVSINHPLARKFSNRLIGELELGFSVPHRKVIAVTGTNGKTTVVNMIHQALRKSVLCGNVGIPVTAVSKEIRRRTAVTEVSSFQLESLGRRFRPNIAVILNVSQDHLERHGTMEEYIRCKARIFQNQKRRDIAVLNFDDPILRNHPTACGGPPLQGGELTTGSFRGPVLDKNKKLNPLLGGVARPQGVTGWFGSQRVLWFSITSRVRGVYLDGNDIMLNLRGRARKIFSLDDFGEDRPHSIQNILATVLVCKLMGCSRRAIISACRPVRQSHRLEYVGRLAGDGGDIVFYNDSKATNIASTLAACRCFQTPVNLIVGGVAKGQDFSELFEKMPNVVQNVFVFGESAGEIMGAAPTLSSRRDATPSSYEGELLSIYKCDDLKEAVVRATAAGTGPRVVLLSPACASFDMFRDYRHRGDVFVEIVGELLNVENS